MKLRILIAAAAIALAGCTTTAQVAGNIGQALSSSTPSQVSTLADAVQAATLCTNAVDLYVNASGPSRATLLELQSLNDAVHKALTDLQAANAKGQSLVFATFNEALAAFQAYSSAKGVAH